MTTPTQIRIPPELLVQIDAAAKDEGVTRTAWLLEAARAKLPVPLAHEVPEPAGVPIPPEPLLYRCSRGCGHEAKTPTRCNFCRSQLVRA